MSMTLNFLGGAPFQLLCDGVKLAMSNSNQFKIHLRRLKFTLDCLQPHVIEQIRLQNQQLNLSVQEIQELQSKITEGIDLVNRLSSLNTWNICIWGNCCNCVTGYADQLDELNESLRRLLEILRLQSIAQVNQIVILSRTARERQDELGRRQLEILSNQRDIIDTLRTQQQVIERIERNGVAASTTREGAVPAQVLHLGAVFQAMSDAVVQVKVKNSMFERHLEDFKFTLDCLKPLVQEIVEHFPKEEILEDFIVDLEKGVELVYRCSKGSLRSWFKKYEYINNLFELDESLQRLFNTLRLQLENDVKEALVSISNLEKEIEEIEGSGVLQQHQYESTAAEPQSPKVELDVMNMQVTRDANDEVGVERIEGSSLPQDQIEVAVAEHPSPTIALDQVNIRETSDSKRNMEVGVERIEGSSLPQGQSEVAVAEHASPTIALDQVNIRETSDSKRNMEVGVERIEGSSLPQGQSEVAVAEHPSPTIALDQVNIRETSDSERNMEVGVDRIEWQGSHISPRAQKVVLKVSTMTDEKTRQKAIEAAADIFGIDSIMTDLKDQKLTLVGMFDTVAVVKKLKKVGKVDIISVGPAKEEKKEEKKDEKKDEKKEGEKKEEKKVDQLLVV